MGSEMCIRDRPSCDMSFLLLPEPGRRPSKLTCAGPARDDRLVLTKLRPRDSTRDVSPDIVVGKTTQRSNADASLSVKCASSVDYSLRVAERWLDTCCVMTERLRDNIRRFHYLATCTVDLAHILQSCPVALAQLGCNFDAA